MNVLRDLRGRAIVVGERVFFNRSGDICLGTVTRIREGVSNSYVLPRTAVGLEHPWKVKPLIFVRVDGAWGYNVSQLIIHLHPDRPVTKIVVAAPGDHVPTEQLNPNGIVALTR